MAPKEPPPEGRLAGATDPSPLVPAESFANAGQTTYVYRDSAGRVTATLTRSHEGPIVYLYDAGGQPMPSEPRPDISFAGPPDAPKPS
jgi:hypothetical protein